MCMQKIAPVSFSVDEYWAGDHLEIGITVDDRDGERWWRSFPAGAIAACTIAKLEMAIHSGVEIETHDWLDVYAEMRAAYAYQENF